MICRKCAEKSATYHIRETDTEGITRDLHLCVDCARDYGFLGVLKPSVKWFLEKLGAGPKDPGYTVRPAAPLKRQICSQDHASIHLFESKDGWEHEAHLCEKCGEAPASVVDAAFMNFPDAPSHAPPRPVCPECGRIRFDFGKIGVEVRGNIQHSMLPIRILLRGCAWSPP